LDVAATGGVALGRGVEGEEDDDGQTEAEDDSEPVHPRPEDVKGTEEGNAVRCEGYVIICRGRI
jgi:hypothetical protein